MKRALIFCLLPACAGQVAHQYDHGRSYTETFAVQSDLNRPSALDQDYSLTGIEGVELRARAEEATTDEEETTTVKDSE